MTDELAAPHRSAPATSIRRPSLPFATSSGCRRTGVAAVVALLDEGNTVPFIARYRKERTGGLDEVQIRAIEERRATWSSSRSAAPRSSRRSPSRASSTPELEAQAARARPARPSSRTSTCRTGRAARRARRSRASAGSSRSPSGSSRRREGDPAARPRRSSTEQVATADDALAGARDIVAETIAETAEVRAFVRREFAEHGELVSEVVPGKDDEPTKFEQYYQLRARR